MSQIAEMPKLAYKLLALFLALIMWVSFSGKSAGPQTRGLRSFTNVPFIHQGVPSTMKLTSEYYQITVSLSGNDSELRQIEAQQVEVRLDLSSYAPGTYNIALGRENVFLPTRFASVEVEEIAPRVVKLSIEPKVRKPIRVVLNTTGRPARYFEVAEIAVIPARAELEGPESQVANLDLLVANPVAVSDAAGDLQGKVNFDFKTQIPPDCTIVNLNELTYHIQIREIRDSRTYRGLLKVAYHLPEDRKQSPKPREVLLRAEGTVRDLEWFQHRWVVPTVEVPPEWDGSPLPIVPVFKLPEEQRQETPDWEARLGRLVIRFEPEQTGG
jgi:hypothetical protein